MKEKEIFEYDATKSEERRDLGMLHKCPVFYTDGGIVSCPPFFLQRGYPSGAELVVGYPRCRKNGGHQFFHGEESPCFFILYATCRGVHPRIFAARAMTQPADDKAS